eukprot:scaffold3769_cov54-Phaeocystis_antarctica.AAC.3
MLSLRATCRFQVRAVVVLSLPPPSTRRVDSGKLHGTHAWSSDWVSMGWRGHRNYSQGAALGAPFGSRFKASWWPPAPRGR